MQDLPSLQNLPEWTRLIDFKLIALPTYDSCLGSPSFPAFRFYPCVYSEIALIVLLSSLMRLCLNSNHRKFDYSLKLYRRLFCLTLCHWVSPRFARCSQGAETPRGAGQGLLRWHHSAEGPTGTSEARHWYLVSKGLGCVTLVWVSSAKQALWPGLSPPSGIISGCCKLSWFFWFLEGGPEGRTKAFQTPKALGQWRRPEADGVG